MKSWDKLEADVDRIMNKHYTPGRSGHVINKIVLHYNYGRLTIEDCWRVWQTRPASAHYQVEEKGRIGQLVWDRDTAWHSGNAAANMTSIGIEHANGTPGDPTGPISPEALDNGAHLVAALCKFYKLGEPRWMHNVFPHKHFSATACPGSIAGYQLDEYMKRARQWYATMTASAPAPQPDPNSEFLVRVSPRAKDGLNIRSGPGTSYTIKRLLLPTPTKFTIVETKGDWGKLKSGIGWVNLNWVDRV